MKDVPQPINKLSRQRLSGRYLFGELAADHGRPVERRELSAKLSNVGHRTRSRRAYREPFPSSLGLRNFRASIAGHRHHRSGTQFDAGTTWSRYSLLLIPGALRDVNEKQGARPMANEQSKRQSDKQQSGQQHQQGPEDQNQQNKSETQRKAEEAARRDKPRRDIGTVGT
jgi:hypothetical protein